MFTIINEIFIFVNNSKHYGQKKNCSIALSIEST